MEIVNFVDSRYVRCKKNSEKKLDNGYYDRILCLY